MLYSEAECSKPPQFYRRTCALPRCTNCFSRMKCAHFSGDQHSKMLAFYCRICAPSVPLIKLSVCKFASRSIQSVLLLAYKLNLVALSTKNCLVLVAPKGRCLIQGIVRYSPYTECTSSNHIVNFSDGDRSYKPINPKWTMILKSKWQR